MRSPEFITFTGADDATSIEGMRELSRRYPIEWGVLFSPRQQGNGGRYPGRDALVRLLYWSGTRLAAQLCGGHSRRIMAGESLAEYIPVDLGICRRIQVNHETPDPTRLVAFRNTWGAARCIAQTRGVWLHGKLQFPGDDSVDWLFDTSRGGGVAPPFWPSHPGGDRLVGYAGGIGPGNILSLIEEVGQSGPYWIDMETSVRSRGRLDLYLCRRVCEMVYGDGL